MAVGIYRSMPLEAVPDHMDHDGDVKIHFHGLTADTKKKEEAHLVLLARAHAKTSELPPAEYPEVEYGAYSGIWACLRIKKESSATVKLRFFFVL